MAGAGAQRHLKLYFDLCKELRKMFALVLSFSLAELPILLNTSVKEQVPVINDKSFPAQTLTSESFASELSLCFHLFRFLCLYICL